MNVVLGLVERIGDRLLDLDLGRVVARAQAAEPADLDHLTGGLAASQARCRVGILCTGQSASRTRRGRAPGSRGASRTVRTVLRMTFLQTGVNLHTPSSFASAAPLLSPARGTRLAAADAGHRDTHAFGDRCFHPVGADHVALEVVAGPVAAHEAARGLDGRSVGGVGDRRRSEAPGNVSEARGARPRDGRSITGSTVSRARTIRVA